MTEEEANSILKEIIFAYPYFEVTEEKINYWINHLKAMPYKPVLYRLEKHIFTSNYPPSVSQISAIEKEENTFLVKLEERRNKLKNYESK